MKTKGILLTTFGILLFFTSSLHAQHPPFQWVKQMGGNSDAEGLSITTDASGNIYTTGYFHGVVDFDPGPDSTNLTSKGGSDIFIQKLDARGNLLWVKQMGGKRSDWASSITTDASGNVYTTGNFMDTVNFDPGTGINNLTSAGNTDVFIQKLDANGNLLWVKQMGGTELDQGSAITTDPDGNVYTTGIFRGIADFDPGTGNAVLTSAGSLDCFIQKRDANGNLLWVKQIGGTSNDAANSITTDKDGNVYTTGYFSGTVDFNPGAETYNLTTAGYKDIFIQKLDKNGNFIWAKQMGATDYIFDGRRHSSGLSIITDGNGNLYTTGHFTHTADFDIGSGNENARLTGIGTNIFILKIDTTGNFIWVKQIGTLGVNMGHSICTDSYGNVYTTGFFKGADFDPGDGTYTMKTAGGDDIFIQKLNPQGEFVWAVQMGGPGKDVGNSITIDVNGNIYTTGYFQKTADFDPGEDTFNLTSAAFGDIFIQKLGSTPVGITESSFPDKFKVYPNPTDGNFAIKFETIQKNLSLRIMSISGQTLETRTFLNTDFIQLKLEQPNGVYLVDVLNEKGKRTGFRLIKKE